jgi:hypothetical protein
LKGQLTQAGRTGARAIAIVRGDGVTLRREGQADKEVSLADVVATLTT